MGAEPFASSAEAFVAFAAVVVDASLALVPVSFARRTADVVVQTISLPSLSYRNRAP